MVRHVANNYGFLLVPSTDITLPSLELLRDFRPVGKSGKQTESTDLKMWRNDEDQEKERARLHSALWRMPRHQGWLPVIFFFVVVTSKQGLVI